MLNEPNSVIILSVFFLYFQDKIIYSFCYNEINILKSTFWSDVLLILFVWVWCGFVHKRISKKNMYITFKNKNLNLNKNVL